MRVVRLVLPAAIVSALPLNVTTYNYISYDVQGFQLNGIDFFSETLVNLNRLEEIHDTDYESRPVLLVSDPQRLKIDHDATNVLYCLMKYLKKIGDEKSVVKLDKELIKFITVNKSTDQFLRRLVGRDDVSKIMQNLRILNEMNGRLNTEFVRSLNGELVQAAGAGANANASASATHGGAAGAAFNETLSETLDVNLVHLYHLIPRHNDHFKYSVFHGLQFQYPDWERSMANSVTFLNETVVRTISGLLNEIRNWEISETREHEMVRAREDIVKLQSANANLQSQINALVVVNGMFVAVKLFGLLRGTSFRRLVVKL